MTVGELYTEHSAHIFRYALRRLGDEHKAEDIVQHTFLLALTNPDKVFEYDKPAQWLTLTAHNLVKRVWVERKEESWDEAVSDDKLCYELQKGLWEVLPKDLSRTDKRIADMLYEKRMTQVEIAETLGITLEACKSRVRRLKKRLQRELTDNQQEAKELRQDAKEGAV